MKIHKEQITLEISEIKEYENNPRINNAAVDDVAESIKQCGYINPIIVDENNVILAGHTRLLAIKKIGKEKIQVLKVTGLSEEQKKKYRILDNKTAEKAEWDFEKLQQELEELDFGDYDFGFDDLQEINFDDEINAKEDNYQGGVPEQPKSKLGDIYELGNHRLICGDSTDVNVIDRLMDGVKADMVFTDPPYNVDYSDKNKFLNNADKGNCIQEDIENDSFADDEQAKNNLWTPAFSNMLLYSKDECSIYVTMPQGGTHMMMMMMSIHEAGWKVKHELIWVKNNHVLGRTDYFYKHEPILYGWNKKHKFYGNGEFDKSVWEIPKPQKSDLHPTMKPIELIANALKNSTKEKDNVLDVFGGSGSTLIACEQLNRRCFMCELDPKYVDVIIDRWEKFTGRKARKIS